MGRIQEDTHIGTHFNMIGIAMIYISRYIHTYIHTYIHIYIYSYIDTRYMYTDWPGSLVVI